jgi:chemotaxis protein methyltransferase WspC
MRLVERFLQQRIGLAIDSLGKDSVQRAVRGRMNACQAPDEAAYLRRLREDQAERQALFEEVVVLETWFFRNQAAFDYLARHLQDTWQVSHGPLKLLSLPCATGEEAYTLAITLLEAGLQPEQFHVDALDLSRRGLELGRAGIYPASSFRCQRAREAQARYFTRRQDPSGAGEYFQINPPLRECVHFAQANLLDPLSLPDKSSYDIVFCRNLLIYLTQDARAEAVARLAWLLRPEGLVFLGHAERALVCPRLAEGFARIRQPGVFACRKLAEKRGAAAFPPASSQPAPEPARPPERPSLAPGQGALPAPLAPRPARAQAEPVHGKLEQARQLADQGRLQQALELSREVLQARVDDAPAYFLHGLIHQALGDEHQAEVFFIRARYLEPRLQEALSLLILLVERRGVEGLAGRLRGRLQRLRGHPDAVREAAKPR